MQLNEFFIYRHVSSLYWAVNYTHLSNTFKAVESVKFWADELKCLLKSLFYTLIGNKPFEPTEWESCWTLLTFWRR